MAEEQEMVLLTEKCARHHTDPECAGRLRYSELTDDRNTHWHVKSGALVPADRIIETGVWCLTCGYFESADDLENGRCMACGCPAGSHTRAKVVPA